MLRDSPHIHNRDPLARTRHCASHPLQILCQVVSGSPRWFRLRTVRDFAIDANLDRRRFKERKALPFSGGGLPPSYPAWVLLNGESSKGRRGRCSEGHEEPNLARKRGGSVVRISTWLCQPAPRGIDNSYVQGQASMGRGPMLNPKTNLLSVVFPSRESRQAINPRYSKRRLAALLT